MTETTIVTPIADTNGSLNGKSFMVYNESGECFRIWGRVSGLTESNPTQPSEISIPFDISPGASVGEICMAIQAPILIPYATQLGCSPMASEEDPEGPAIAMVFYTLSDGATQDALDVDTGFNVSVYEQGE